MFCCVADKFPSACIRQQSTLHLLPRRKKEALHEKELGNEAYKAKRFDEAIAHYDRCAACLATCLPLLAAVSLPQLPSNRCALRCALPAYLCCLPACLPIGRAIELWDQDVSFLSNRAAVHFEKGDFERCMADCDAGTAPASRCHCVCVCLPE